MRQRNTSVFKIDCVAKRLLLLLVVFGGIVLRGRRSGHSNRSAHPVAARRRKFQSEYIPLSVLHAVFSAQKPRIIGHCAYGEGKFTAHVRRRVRGNGHLIGPLRHRLKGKAAYPAEYRPFYNYVVGIAVGHARRLRFVGILVHNALKVRNSANRQRLLRSRGKLARRRVAYIRRHRRGLNPLNVKGNGLKCAGRLYFQRPHPSVFQGYFNGIARTEGGKAVAIQYRCAVNLSAVVSDVIEVHRVLLHARRRRQHIRNFHNNGGTVYIAVNNPLVAKLCAVIYKVIGLYFKRLGRIRVCFRPFANRLRCRMVSPYRIIPARRRVPASVGYKGGRCPQRIPRIVLPAILHKVHILNRIILAQPEGYLRLVIIACVG